MSESTLWDVSAYRFVAHPKWLAGHMVVIVTAVTMVLLGRWQMTVSEQKGFDLQNFGYALQWWAFSLAGVWFWFRLIRDKAHGVPFQQEPKPVAGKTEQAAYRRYVMPNQVSDDDDPERIAYNNYLRQLNEQS